MPNEFAPGRRHWNSGPAKSLVERLRNPDYGAEWKTNVALMREAAYQVERGNQAIAENAEFAELSKELRAIVEKACDERDEADAKLAAIRELCESSGKSVCKEDLLQILGEKDT